MKAARLGFLLAGIAGVVILVTHIGIGPLEASLRRVRWWQFLLVCIPQGLGFVADGVAWRFAFTRHVPNQVRLVAARIAGHSFNVFTALVGGEAVKIWLLHAVTSYDESVPAVVIDKTAITTAQTLFLAVGLIVGTVAMQHRQVVEPTMIGLLGLEVLAVGGFFLTQVTGVVGRAGRLLAGIGLLSQPTGAARVDTRLREYYRRDWPRFGTGVAWHLGGCVMDTLGTWLLLRVLRIPVTLAGAVVIEALGSGVQFTTFFIPGSLGVLEGTNAGVFASLGLGATAGLAFTLVRRARELAWVGVGGLIVLGMRGYDNLQHKRV